MTIVIPDARTPAGVKCWVRDYEDRPWAEHVFEGMLTASGYPFLAYSRNWRFCRLDDPVEGWVSNTGTMPDVNGPIDLKFENARTLAPQKAASWNWDLNRPPGGRITHWRYPRTKEPEMKPHPQADILRRIADGEELIDRVWSFSGPSNRWIKCGPWAVLVNPGWTFAVSDEPGVPPPLPRPMIQLRPGGPKYYRGETVAPGDDVMVWCIWHLNATAEHSESTWKCWTQDVQAKMLRLGLVHLSEANYKLHMAALEDLMLWAHARGVKPPERRKLPAPHGRA